MNNIKYLVVHCSATPPTMNIGKEEIKQWHLERGWSDIGYHVVIRRNGVVEYGRPFDKMGAHIKGYNKNSLGVCLVGGVDDKGKPSNNFTERQFNTLGCVLTALEMLFPGASIRGHRDFPGVTKACPSFDVDLWRKSYPLA